MPMTIQPLNDRVLIKPCPLDEITAGGILLPDSVRDEDSNEGIVLDPGGHLRLAEGDRIVYSKYAGSEIKLDGDSYILIPERHILAVFRETPNE